MARYFLTHLDGHHEVEIDDEAQAQGLRVVLDGQEHFVDAQHLQGELMHLLIDGISYDVDIERVGAVGPVSLGEHCNVRVHNAVVAVEVLSERQHNMRELDGVGAGATGSQNIAAPMPGKVVKLLVKQGDHVSAGQGLVVVEAMKMENELQSPVDGVVATLTAIAGQTVEAGASLLVVEAE